MPIQQQPLLLSLLPELRSLWERYNRPADRIKQLERAATDFRVYVPLVGAFSSGKSSLLNAVLGTPLLGINITAETALPCELHYAEQTRYFGHTPQGRIEALSTEAYQKKAFDAFLPDGWLSVEVNADALKAYPHLVLVDMPGWDSGIELHNRAIDAYVDRSLAYCIVVSADEGTLRDSLRRFLEELEMRNKSKRMPIILVITKSDKKPQQDVDAVTALITQEVHRIYGEAPLLATAQVSATRKRTDPFRAALAQLEQLAPERFHVAVGLSWIAALKDLSDHLHVLSNQENLTGSELQIRQEQETLALAEFQKHLQDESEQLDKQCGPAVENITRLVRSRLQSQADSLAHAAQYDQQSLRTEINHCTRLAITEGLETEFEPRVRHYMEKVSQHWSANIPLAEFAQNRRSRDDTDDDSTLSIDPTLLTTILTSAGSLLGKIHPAVAMILSVLVEGFGKFLRSKGEREIQKIEERERARQHIVTQVIPDVCRHTESTLRTMLRDSVDKIQDDIQKKAQQQIANHQARLEELQRQLQKNAQDYEEQRQQFLRDKDAVDRMIDTIEESAR